MRRVRCTRCGSRRRPGPAGVDVAVERSSRRLRDGPGALCDAAPSRTPRHPISRRSRPPSPPRWSSSIALPGRRPWSRTARMGTKAAGRAAGPRFLQTGGSWPSVPAAGLLAADTNRKRDVYVLERAVDGIQRISLARDGSPANGDSRDPSISGDGSVIAFASTATTMTRDRGLDGTTSQVFAWQRASGSVSLVSIGADGRGSGGSSGASTSRDGRVVAFESNAADLVDGDSKRVRDVFLRDLTRQATIRASVRSNGRQVDVESRRPSISGDGGAVVFDSTAPSLVPNDTNCVRDVFVRDLPPAVQVTPTPLDFGVGQLGHAGHPERDRGQRWLDAGHDHRQHDHRGPRRRLRRRRRRLYRPGHGLRHRVRRDGSARAHGHGDPNGHARDLRLGP